MSTAQERALLAIEALGDAIDRETVDVRPIADLLDPPTRHSADLIRPALLKGLAAARKMLARADRGDAPVGVVDIAVGHGTLTDASGVTVGAWFDVELADGRRVSCGLGDDPDTLRSFAVCLLDNAEALADHLAGRPCKADR